MLPPIEAFAPAKVNLTLHVVGCRADGYHLLDSLVVFACVGDRLRVQAAQQLRLRVTGPRAVGVPQGEANLVLRAARLLGGSGAAAEIELEKHLPAGAGIGGGSSDGAAALRALAQLWDVALPGTEAVMALGADVPVCLAGTPARMSGVGEVLSAVPPLPSCWLVLANPGVEVPTGAVFSALERREGPPMPAVLPRWRDAAELAAWIGEMRNDLEAPARGRAPVIDRVQQALAAQPGCLVARMSGSGATCFGLFAEPLAAAAAARGLGSAEPDWWVTHAAVLQDAAFGVTDGT